MPSALGGAARESGLWGPSEWVERSRPIASEVAPVRTGPLRTESDRSTADGKVPGTFPGRVTQDLFVGRYQ